MTLSLSAISQLLSLAFCEVGTENTKPSLNKSIFKKKSLARCTNFKGVTRESFIYLERAHLEGSFYFNHISKHQTHSRYKNYTDIRKREVRNSRVTKSSYEIELR